MLVAKVELSATDSLKLLWKLSAHQFDIIVIPKLSPFVLMIMQLLDQNLSVF